MWGTAYLAGHQLRKSRMLIWMLRSPLPWSKRWPQDELWLTQQECGQLTLALSRSKFDIIADRVSKLEVLWLVPTPRLWRKKPRTTYTSDLMFQNYPERQLYAHPWHTLAIYHIVLSKRAACCPKCSDPNGLCVSSTQVLILSLPGLTFS